MTTVILSVLGVSALTLIIIFYVNLKKENKELKKNSSIPGGGIPKPKAKSSIPGGGIPKPKQK